MSVNKWILLVLALWVATILAIVFLEIPTTAPISYDILADLPISSFAIYLVSCLVMPIIEEYAFRYWTLAKGYKKYLSLLLFAAFVLLSLKSIVLITAFALVLVYILVAKNAPIVFKIIASAVFFSLLHLNVGTLNLSFFSYFVFYILLAVLFNLLYYKKGIWLSILVHISYNTLLLIFLDTSYKGFENKSEVFTLNQTTCTLQQHNIFYTNSFPRSRVTPDTIMVKGYNKSSVVWKLLRKQEAYIYEVAPSLNKISLTITGSSVEDRRRIIEKALKLKFDTIGSEKVDVYEILYKPNAAQIAACQQTKTDKDYTNTGPLAYMSEVLTQQYGILVNSKDTNVVYLNIPYELSFEQKKQILESKYGLKFIKSEKEIKKIYVSFKG